MTDTGVGVPTSPDDKPFWQSKTIIGAGVAIVCTVIESVFHKVIAPDTQNQLVELVLQVGQIGGGLIAIIGRLTASKDLK